MFILRRFYGIVCPVCRGMSIRNGVESLSGIPWNRHPEWRGITHRIDVEYTVLAFNAIKL
jgi:hypothetical protein